MVGRKKRSNLTITNDLPAIPDKMYFSIGEVSDLCELKPHVLRYWEQEFSQLKPMKRRGNRRYYQQKDVCVVRTIRELLYLQGFTIEGARLQLVQIIGGKGRRRSVAPEPIIHTRESHAPVETVIEDLKELLDEIEA